ncbi:DMT family transporter [Shewanella maritima]|uniref:DMT family transporter n=1 Tax=Shewanella maritima TaxID=2520507 RepID=UPI00373653A5
MTSNQLAYIYGLGAVLLWSTVASAFKIALTFFSPIQLVWVAVVTSALAIFTILVVQKKLHLIARQFKQRPLFYCFMGLLNPFLYYFVLFKAYDLLPAQQALSLNYTWAILLPILAVPMLKHKLIVTDVLAAIIGYCGVFVIATNGQITQMSITSPLGVGLALLSTVIWCLYWMLNAKDNGDPIISLFLGFIAALPIILITLLMTEGLPQLSVKALLAGMYVGLFEMGLTFVLWLLALKNTTKTANISTLAFLTPVLSVGVIAAVLQESIHQSTIVGLLLILSGLILQKIWPKIFSSKQK